MHLKLKKSEAHELILKALGIPPAINPILDPQVTVEIVDDETKKKSTTTNFLKEPQWAPGCDAAVTDGPDSAELSPHTEENLRESASKKSKLSDYDLLREIWIGWDMQWENMNEELKQMLRRIFPYLSDQELEYYLDEVPRKPAGKLEELTFKLGRLPAWAEVIRL